MAGLTIGKFAAAAGVGVETVRFYQRRGLLPLPQRGSGGFREYTEADQWRMSFIRRARELGFTLGEIGDLLGPAARAQSTDDIAAAAQVKLAALDDQFRELARQRCRLRRLVQVCEHGSGSACLALDTGAVFDADVLASPKPVIVECWAPWCGPCRQVGPVLEAIAADHAGRVDVVKLNVDENPQTTRRFGIMVVPTLNLFSGGTLVKQVFGARSKAALLREFADYLEPADAVSQPR